MQRRQAPTPDPEASGRSQLGFIVNSEEWTFAKETFKNVVIFFGWAFVALGIQVFVGWLEKEWGAGPYIMTGAVVVEVAIIVADVIWFIVRLTVDTAKTIVRSFFEVRAFIRAHSDR